MKLRRSTAALVGAAVLAMSAAPAALAADDSVPADENGLYGEGDPTYDGVYRQSAALLATRAADAEPPPAAVSWLLDQVCADSGAFTAYRADTGTVCGDEGDTNATAMAVQALAAETAAHPDAETPHDTVVSAVRWLMSVRNDDGGWPYTAGEASDANSTALVLGALAAADASGVDVEGSGTVSPEEALAGFRIGCADAGDGASGGYAWQPDPDSGELFFNESATVDAALAAQGGGLLVDPAGADPQDAAPRVMTCDGDRGLEPAGGAAEAAAGEVAALLEANDQHVVNSLADNAPDFALTSTAVLALAAGGYQETLSGPLTWLEEQHTDWADFDTAPGALASLILAAHAGGADPADFGGTDLVAALTALGPDSADGQDAPDGEASAEDEATEDDGDTSAGWLLWMLGVGLLAGGGIGFLLSMRKRAASAPAPASAQSETRDTAAEAGQDGTDGGSRE